MWRITSHVKALVPDFAAASPGRLVGPVDLHLAANRSAALSVSSSVFQRRFSSESGDSGKKEAEIVRNDFFADYIRELCEILLKGMDIPLPNVLNVVNAREAHIKGHMIPVSAWIVLRALKWQGFEAYLVGGCVRDLFIHRTPRDFDVVTTANLRQVEHLFAVAPIIGKRHPICRVDIKQSIIEVSHIEYEFAAPDGWEKRHYRLYQDSLKRDFTINSLFLNPFCFKIYDYNNGVEDLESRMLRTVISADKSFAKDCARVLRGVRIAARLDLSLSEEIEAAIPRFVDSVAQLNSFRLMKEMDSMFCHGAAVSSIHLLRKLKILHVLLPFQAVYLESGEEVGEEETPLSYVMLQTLFSCMDKLYSCDNPASQLLWIALLALHTALVVHPVSPIVVCAAACILCGEKLEKSLMFARKHEEDLTEYWPEFAAYSVYDEDMVEAIRALGFLVRKYSDILVDRRRLSWELSDRDIPNVRVFIGKAEWKCACDLFVVFQDPTTYKKVFPFVVDSCVDERVDLSLRAPSVIGKVLGEIILKTIEKGISDQVLESKSTWKTLVCGWSQTQVPSTSSRRRLR